MDRTAKRSFSDQLTHNVRAAILSGSIRPGDELPASRTLAGTLGISRSVVVSVYERLIGEGYLESRQGAGTRVVAEIPHWGLAAQAELAADRVDPERDPDPPAVPVTSTPATSAPIDLRPGRPYTAPVPPREWVRALSRAAREPWQSTAPASNGEAQLRAAIAAHARRSRGIDCDADDVVLTSGTSEALFVIALALKEIGDADPRIAVEDPGYREGTQALARAGATLLPLRVGADGATAADVGALAAATPVSAIMVTPSHQFPLGGRISAAERHALIGWARTAGAWIIEDDYDSEFRHEGAVLPAMASLDHGGQVIHVTTLNKILSPSMRCGAIILGRGTQGDTGKQKNPVDQLRAAVAAVREDLGASVSLMTQLALAEFLDSGGFRREIGRTRREYRHRRELLLQACATHGLTVTGAAGGLHVTLSIPAGVDGAKLVTELARGGVLVDHLHGYQIGNDPGIRPDPAREDGLVVGYGAEPVVRMLRGIEHIARVLAT